MASSRSIDCFNRCNDALSRLTILSAPGVPHNPGMTKPLKLYRHPISGHAHRVELFLSLLGLPFESITVDLAKRAHKEPGYLAKNPLGQVPVLEDGDLTLSDSNAILVYLALRYDEGRRYYPDDAVTQAQIQRWFSIAAGELANGVGLLRRAALFRAPVDRSAPEATAQKLLVLMEQTLADTRYLVGSTVTLADLALFSYVAHAPEGGVSLEPYPHVRKWIASIEALPNFVGMVRTPTPAPAG